MDKTEDLPIKTVTEFPEGTVIERVVEVVQFINPDGQPAVAVRWQCHTGNVVSELGMLEYAKQELIMSRFAIAEEPEEGGEEYDGG